MGFFDDLWSGIKSVGSSVWNGVKDTAGTVYNTAKSGVDWVADKIQPIVKTVGDIASYVPVIGAPISGIANQISKGIDVARGFVSKAGDVGKSVGLFREGSGAMGKPKFSRMTM
jgi:phage-related protein